MKKLAGLFVFEGPDGIGKSSLLQGVAAALRALGQEPVELSFPGRQEGTLGRLVYRIHHEPETLGVHRLDESTRQLLHVAAHLDAIQHVIRPALQGGGLVLLDRFWWSTEVYGLVGGMDPKVIDRILAVELATWGNLRPRSIFLLTRAEPFRAECATRTWKRLAATYASLARRESKRYVVEKVPNTRPFEAVVERIVEKVVARGSRARGHSERPATRQLSLGFETHTPRFMRTPSDEVKRRWAPAEPTVVFDTYWRFAAERQRIFFRRQRGIPRPWTSDPILQNYKFTNAYRAADRISQYLIRHVIYRGPQNREDLFTRILLFKFFNKIETWDLLEREHGPIRTDTFSVPTLSRVLQDAMRRRERIYSAAYIMPSAERTLGASKHDTHLRLLARMLDDGLPERIARVGSLREAFELLRTYPMMGEFLAYQYVIDLNYSGLLNFSEMEFIVPGPGARDGIAKCFRSLGGLTEAEIIQLVTSRQEEEFERVGERFETLWGRPLQLIDCQNLFCEVDKYARLFHPDIKGRSSRDRIKQIYRAPARPFEYWFPPKWGLNERMKRSK